MLRCTMQTTEPMSDRASEMPVRSDARRDFVAPGAIVLAPPSVLASWVFALLTEACALLPAKLQARIIDREDPLPSDADVPRIYLSHYPSAPLLGVCEQGDGPILLCLDDPVDSVRFLRQTLGSGVVEALRAETAAAASYSALRTQPRLLILHRLAEASAAEIVELILDHLGLFLGGKERQALTQRWLPEGDPEAGLEAALRARIPGYAPLGESGLGTKDVAMIGGVLSPLLQMSFRETA